MKRSFAVFLNVACLFSAGPAVASSSHAMQSPSLAQSDALRNTLSVRSDTRAMWLSFPFWDMPWQKKTEFVAYLSQHGINKVFLSVYDNGVARWNSQVLARHGLAEVRNDAEFLRVVTLFRRQKIDVAAFFEGGLSVFLNQRFARERQNWLQRCGETTRSAEHGGHLMSFLDPSRSEAMEIVFQALEELARHPAEFREIQLDRFRFSHGARWKICSTAQGSSSPEHIHAVVRRAYLRIKSVNPSIVVSASPVGSYGHWKLGQRWGTWAKRGHIDAIATQAYVPPYRLEDCRAGTRQTAFRKQSLAILKGELASVLGNSALLEEAVRELKAAGGNVNELELSFRRPMVKTRAWELNPATMPRPVPITIGVMAHQFDDSECVLEQLTLARRLGFTDAALWVSHVAPRDDGSPNPLIHDNLALLKKTLWRPWGALSRR